MAVVLGSLSEGLGIGVSGLGTEQLGLLPVPGNTLAPEVAEVGACSASAPLAQIWGCG